MPYEFDMTTKGGITDEVKYPEIEAEIIGGDGNVFAVIGTVSKALKRGLGGDEGREAAKAFQSEVTQAGSYEEALAIVGQWVTIG